jgi:hypothetical protein
MGSGKQKSGYKSSQKKEAQKIFIPVEEKNEMPDKLDSCIKKKP